MDSCEVKGDGYTIVISKLNSFTVELLKFVSDWEFHSFNGNSNVGVKDDCTGCSNNRSVGRNQKAPYIVKWLVDKRIGDVFELSHFYEDYPKQRSSTRIWEHINKYGLKGKNSEYELLARKIKPRDRYYLNVYDRESGTVKILSVGITLYKKIVQTMLDKDYGDITDPKDGNDFKIIMYQEGGYPRYDQSSPRPKSSPLESSQMKINEILASSHDLNSLIKEESYDELKGIAMNLVIDSEEDEDNTQDMIDKMKEDDDEE